MSQNKIPLKKKTKNKINKGKIIVIIVSPNNKKMYKKNVKKKLISIGEIDLTEKRQSSITEFASPLKK